MTNVPPRTDHDARFDGAVVLGPTGAGKTPLGDALAAEGWRGQRCLHFDFGRNLRRAAAGQVPGLSADEVEFVRQVLDEGRLLEADSFYLAEHILRGFLQAHAAQPDDVVLLNGLPRHVGQTQVTDKLVAVRRILLLEAGPEVVLARLRTNAGGDRAQRTDDHPALVQRKLQTYRERTLPLVAHYRKAGAHLITLEVDITTHATALRKMLNA